MTATNEEESEVRIRAALFGLETAYGSVKPSAAPEDFDEICKNAKDAKVEDELGSYKLAKGAVPLEARRYATRRSHPPNKGQIFLTFVNFPIVEPRIENPRML